jgi:glycosyltransferase involved in cell wall biosynthesis
MSIRVAAFMNTEIVSGPGRQLAALARPLRAHGIELTIVCVLLPDAVDSPYTRFLKESGVEFTVMRTDGRFRPALVRAMADAIDALAPDIVQTHSYRPASIAWWLRRRRVSWRWVGFFHGETHEDLKVRLYNAVDRLLLHRADAVVVVASTQLARFRRRAGVSQIPNAVIPSPEVEDASQAALLTLPAPPRVGFVGRLSREKGLDVLLDATAMLDRRGVRFSLLLAGDGPDRSMLAEQARRLGVSDRVSFLGSVSNVGTVYRSIDVLVLPSRTEGMPNVLLEAARHDVPMVATSVGDVPSILADDQAGLTVAPGDANALAAAIEQALRRGRTPAGSAARAALAQRFSLDERARAHAELYSRLVGRHAAS